MQLDMEQGFTPAERNAVIRFAITVGDRAKCSTRSLLRPLKMSDLQAAFREREEGHRRTIEEYRKKAEEYEEGVTPLSERAIKFFGGVPTKEDFVSYCNDIIKQEREMLRHVRRGYHVAVDFQYTPKKLLRFHQSLSPRVTFGYTSVLHEECDFALTDEVRQAFLNSSLAELPAYKEDFSHDFGYVFFDSIIALFYEDFAVFKGERCILDTVSHERMFTVDLSGEELEALRSFEGKKNGKLVQKIESAADDI